MPKLVIASASYGVHAPEALDLLARVFDRIERVELRAGEREEAVIAKVGDADALILGGGGPVTRRVMEECANLKIIARHGIGLDNVDLEAATELGIPVTYCRHTGEEVSVAEHTVALMLACARRLVEADRAVREGRWGARVELVGLELRGKTLGVIGLGAIGREVARIARNGFGMRVVAYDPYAPQEAFREVGAERVGLEELLRESDFITIHVPLTPETRRMLNAERLKLVKRGAVIVNTARGAVIDEAALCEALREGRVAYAEGGEPGESFRKCVEVARSMYVRPVEGLYDSALVFAEPLDIDLYQATKALEHAAPAVEEGGSLVLAAACPRGYGSEEFKRLASMDGEAIEELLRSGWRGNVVPAIVALRMKEIFERYSVTVFTEGPLEGLKGAELARSAREALSRLRGRVLVVKRGGFTVPQAR